MDRTLEMVFENEEEKTSKITLRDPREDLDDSDVKGVMEDILTRNIFDSPGGDLVKILGAKVISKEVEEFDVLD